MKRVILTIAIVLCAAPAFADNHRDRGCATDNGHHYGRHGKYDSPRDHGCGDEREWQPRHVAYRPQYREVREFPAQQVAYRPEYRYDRPRVAVALPSFPFSLSIVFR